MKFSKEYIESVIKENPQYGIDCIKHYNHYFNLKVKHFDNIPNNDKYLFFVNCFKIKKNPDFYNVNYEKQLYYLGKL